MNASVENDQLRRKQTQPKDDLTVSRPERPRQPSGKMIDLPLKASTPDLEVEPRPGAPPPPAVRPPAPIVKRTRKAPPPAPGARPWLAAVLALAAGALAGWFLKPDPAVTVLSSELLDFGEVRIETASEALSVEVTNGGGWALPVGRVVVEGGEAEEFGLTSDGCSGQSLAAGNTCTVEVAFTPGGTGPRRSWLRIEGQEGKELPFPPRLPLLGLGVAPQLEAEPLKLDFGEQLVGSASRRSSVRIANRGSAPLTIRGVELRGNGAGDFAVRDRCSGQRLAPGERCGLEYSFLPTVDGERRAQLHLTTDGGDALAASPELVGRGLPRQAALRISPARLEFDPTRVGTASAPLKLTLNNDGTAPLRFRELSIRSDNGSGRFELRSGACTRDALGPGKSCAVDVVFQPASEGDHTAKLAVHPDSGGARTIPLSGAGTLPKIFLDPLVLEFSQVQVGSLSDSKFLRVVNSGSGPLVIESIRLRGTGAQAFTARPVGCTTAPIKPKSSCGVEVRFQPHRGGAFQAELTLTHNAEGGSSRVEIRGLGRVP